MLPFRVGPALLHRWDTGIIVGLMTLSFLCEELLSLNAFHQIYLYV